MNLIQAFFIAICTYSVLPAPIFDWNSDNMRYSICFFPVVGIVVGAALWLWNLLAGWLQMGSLLFSVVAALLPILITGGIHMDGFMDTVDALSSHRERERKLEILKDSHCGAFAVLYCCVYLLLSVAFFSAAYESGNVLPMVGAYFLSRCLSAFCVLTMKNARGSGMLASFTEPVQGKKALTAVCLTGLAGAVLEICFFGIPGILLLVFGLLTMLWYRWKTMKEFGGVTGDTSGFFLQLCELMLLLAAVVGGYVCG